MGRRIVHDGKGVVRFAVMNIGVHWRGGVEFQLMAEGRDVWVLDPFCLVGKALHIQGKTVQTTVAG